MKIKSSMPSDPRMNIARDWTMAASGCLVAIWMLRVSRSRRLVPLLCYSIMRSWRLLFPGQSESLSVSRLMSQSHLHLSVWSLLWARRYAEENTYTEVQQIWEKTKGWPWMGIRDEVALSFVLLDYNVRVWEEGKGYTWEETCPLTLQNPKTDSKIQSLFFRRSLCLINLVEETARKADLVTW